MMSLSGMKPGLVLVLSRGKSGSKGRGMSRDLSPTGASLPRSVCQCESRGMEPEQWGPGATCAGGGMVKSVSAYAELQRSDRKSSPVSVYVPPPDYESHNDDIIKPRKLSNPVKESKSHRELHRELLTSCKRAGDCVELKPELQRVLESRRRDQKLKLRKKEDEAHRKLSPLEQELQRRHHILEELELQEERLKLESSRAPEFIKVKQNLRRTSRDQNQDQD